MSSSSFMAISIIAVASLGPAAIGQGGVSWMRRTELHPRSEHALVHDSTRGKVLVLGGVDLRSEYGFDGLWELEGSIWSFGSSMPSLGRLTAAWDESTGTLFACRTRALTYPDFLRWSSAAAWTPHLLPPSAYTASGLSLVYDPTNRVILLVCHPITGGVEVFSWSGTAFQLLSSGQGPSYQGKLVADPNRGRVLWFGPASGGTSTEVWSYANRVWSRIPTTSAPRDFIENAVARDPATGEFLLIGGRTNSPPYIANGETWSFDGSQWRQLQPALAPSPRSGLAMVGDPARQRIVLFGGYDEDGDRSDTWAWNGGTWQLIDADRSLGSRFPLSAVYDSHRECIVASLSHFDGRIQTMRTWEYDGENWIRRTGSLPIEGGPGWVYDPRQRVVVRHSSQGTTRVWDGVGWTIATTSGPPASASFSDLGWDGTRVVLLDLGGTQNATWFWDGVAWRVASPTQQPSRGRRPRMAYDERRQKLVAFLEEPSAPQMEVWEWNGSDWTRAGTVPGRYAFGLAYSRARSRIIVAGGNTFDPVVNYNYLQRDGFAWDGATWREFFPTGGVFPFSPTLVPTSSGGVLAIGGLEGVPVTEHSIFSHELQSRAPATATPFGSGCSGSAVVPQLVLAPWERPWLGDRVEQEVRDLPLGTLAATVLFGVQNRSWLGFSLPLDLAAFGSPGCHLLVPPDATSTVSAANGVARWSIPVPLSTILIGQQVFEQVFSTDPAASPPRLAFSAGLELTIGQR